MPTFTCTFLQTSLCPGFWQIISSHPLYQRSPPMHPSFGFKGLVFDRCPNHKISQGQATLPTGYSTYLFESSHGSGTHWDVVRRGQLVLSFHGDWWMISNRNCNNTWYFHKALWICLGPCGQCQSTGSQVGTFRHADFSSHVQWREAICYLAQTLYRLW